MSKLFSFLCVLLLCGLGATAQAAPTKARRFLKPLPPLEMPARAALPALAPPASTQTTVYGGQDAQAAGLTLTPWGGGSVQDGTAMTLSGGHSLSVTTVDLFQGGTITFRTPVPLGDLADRTRFLQMSLHFPQATEPQSSGGGRFGGRRGRFGGGPGGFGGGPGGFGGGPGGFGGGPGGFGGGRGRFGGGPGGFGGGRGRFGGRPNFGGRNNGAQADNPNPNGPPLVTTLCWVLTLADGRQAEVLRPLPEEAVMGNDWVNVAVPLSVLTFSGGAASGQASLQSLTVTADGYSQFSIGTIQIVTDTTPITASAGVSQTVNAGDQVILHATADGGASDLRYAWDFDTQGAFVDQAEGQTVATQYNTSGKDYTVTLMVSDVDGIKKPATDTVVIHVP